MIDDLDGQLQSWIRSKLEGVDVSLGPPVDSTEGQGVSLYLMDLAPKPPGRGDRRPPLQVRARYLVTTWGEEPEEAHAALGLLLFAAMEESSFEVEPLSVSSETWSAFGLAPRPSFVLAATVRKELPDVPAKLVLEPVFAPSPIASLYGLVMTPDDIPVARASVELPNLQALAVTDSRGRFRFTGVPTDPPTKVIWVTAKGRKEVYEIEALADENDPLLLRFDPREG